MNDWNLVSFKEIVEFPPKVKLEKGQTYSFIPMEDIDGINKYVTPKNEKEWKGTGGAKFEDGDTLFARITPCLQNGKISQAKNLKDGKGFGSTEYFIFRGVDSVSDSDYVYYLAQTSDFRKYAIGSMVGASGRQRADAKYLGNYEVRLPPLHTQMRIASILSGYDDLIENNTRRIKLLEELAQRTYEEWFVKFKINGKELQIDEGSDLPKGWTLVPLSEITHLKYGSMPDKKMISREGFPIYSGYRITGTYPKYNIDEPAIIIVARGVGGTGDVKISPRKCWLTNLSIKVTPIESSVLMYYLYYKLKNDGLRILDSGAAQSQITIVSLNNYKICCPALDVQKNFETFCKPIFEMIENLQIQNSNLKQARDILLPRLMSGEIDVENAPEELITVM